MMKNMICLLAALLMMCTLASCAQAAVNDPVPEEVRSTMDWRYGGGYEIEDFIILEDAGMDAQMDAEGTDYALALLRDSDKRWLVCFKREANEEEFFYGYTVIDCIPQGDNRAQMQRHSENHVSAIDAEGDGPRRCPDDLGFTVALLDESGETWVRSVSFHYRDGAFHLESYASRQHGQACYVCEDDTLIYDLPEEGRMLGTVQASLISDMRYVDLAQLPMTLEAAKESGDIPPGFPYYDHPYWHEMLRGQVMRFDGGRNHKVYMGPGEKYPRSGNGKGTVSTNGWIQVFGSYKGFLLIQYHIDGDRYRIGWIDDSALNRGMTAAALTLHEENGAQEVYLPCALTDDPMGSGNVLAELEPGTPVWPLQRIGVEWELVRVIIDGQAVYGFVPGNCITHG